MENVSTVQVLHQELKEATDLLIQKAIQVYELKRELEEMKRVHKWELENAINDCIKYRNAISDIKSLTNII